MPKALEIGLEILAVIVALGAVIFLARYIQTEFNGDLMTAVKAFFAQFSTAANNSGSASSGN